MYVIHTQECNCSLHEHNSNQEYYIIAQCSNIVVHVTTTSRVAYCWFAIEDASLLVLK